MRKSAARHEQSGRYVKLPASVSSFWRRRESWWTRPVPPRGFSQATKHRTARIALWHALPFLEPATTSSTMRCPSGRRSLRSLHPPASPRPPFPRAVRRERVFGTWTDDAASRLEWPLTTLWRAAGQLGEPTGTPGAVRPYPPAGALPVGRGNDSAAHS